MSLTDRVFSNETFLKTLDDLNDEERESVEAEVTEMAEGFQKSITDLISRIRTDEDAGDLIRALDVLLSPESEELWRERS